MVSCMQHDSGHLALARAYKYGMMNSRVHPPQNWNNVGKTIVNRPPSHWYIRYTPFPNGWFMTVLPILETHMRLEKGI